MLNHMELFISEFDLFVLIFIYLDIIFLIIL